MNWTPDRVTQFETLFHQGLSFAQISRQMGDGLTRSAAIGKAHRLGLSRSEAGKPGVEGRKPRAPRPKAAPLVWTPEKRTLAETMWLDGRPDAEIVAALGKGFTAAALRNHMSREGIARPSKVRLARTAPHRDAGPSASFDRGALADARPGQLHLVRRADAAPVDPASLKTLAERGRDECCWPVGAADPVRGQLFCGRRTAPRKSYCCDHSPAQPSVLKEVRMKDETVRSARPSRDAFEIDLVEAFA